MASFQKGGGGDGIWVESRKVENIWKVSVSSLSMTDHWANPVANVLGLVIKSAIVSLTELQSRRLQMSYTMRETTALQLHGGLGKPGLWKGRDEKARTGIFFHNAALRKTKVETHHVFVTGLVQKVTEEPGS